MGQKWYNTSSKFNKEKVMKYHNLLMASKKIYDAGSKRWYILTPENREYISLKLEDYNFLGKESSVRLERLTGKNGRRTGRFDEVSIQQIDKRLKMLFKKQ